MKQWKIAMDNVSTFNAVWNHIDVASSYNFKRWNGLVMVVPWVIVGPFLPLIPNFFLLLFYLLFNSVFTGFLGVIFLLLSTRWQYILYNFPRSLLHRQWYQHTSFAFFDFKAKCLCNRMVKYGLLIIFPFLYNSHSHFCFSSLSTEPPPFVLMIFAIFSFLAIIFLFMLCHCWCYFLDFNILFSLCKQNL